uniref:Uncharacterized protein n=1 Tax=Timema bartmani TaxID=61472 RepID=A0A7R9EWP0_9NEOP|nr:unnamed protein product [Timema bartmani]
MTSTHFNVGLRDERNSSKTPNGVAIPGWFTTALRRNSRNRLDRTADASEIEVRSWLGVQREVPPKLYQSYKWWERLTACVRSSVFPSVSVANMDCTRLFLIIHVVARCKQERRLLAAQHGGVNKLNLKDEKVSWTCVEVNLSGPLNHLLLCERLVGIGLVAYDSMPFPRPAELRRCCGSAGPVSVVRSCSVILAKSPVQATFCSHAHTPSEHLNGVDVERLIHLVMNMTH